MFLTGILLTLYCTLSDCATLVATVYNTMSIICLRDHAGVQPPLIANETFDGGLMRPPAQKRSPIRR